MRTPKNWLLLPAAALALSTAPRARAAEKDTAHTSAHLAAAERLYQKLDLDAAMAELKEAESDARANNDDNEIVTVLIYKGLIYADNGKTEEMTEYFKRALAMRPWVEVPADTSPRLAKLFNDSRKELWGSGGQLKPPPKKRPHPPSTASVTSSPAAPAPAPEAAPSAPAPAATDTLAPPPSSPPETPAPAQPAPAK